jgi:hypothetical protein
MLKSDRIWDPMGDDLRWHVNTVAERGGILCVSTGGSGGYPGDKSAVAAYKVDPSGGKPVGLLVQDVVDYDTNRQHENWQKGGFVARKGSKALVSTKGSWTTNMIVPGVSPAAGDTAYLGASGLITNVQATGAPKIGQFRTSKDADGYAAVRLNLL